MSSPSESSPLLPSFRSAHEKNTTAHPALTLPRAMLAFLLGAIASLARLFSQSAADPILPTVAPGLPPAPNISSRTTLASRSEKATTRTTLPQDSVLVVITRSELPSTTYPTSSLKKTPSCDSILPMKEVRSVRFSAIIDIHEFSRLAGEPVGMVPTSKAPGVKIPLVENEMRHGSRERARAALEFEPAPLKSSYNHKLIDDSEYSQPRYGSPIY